MYPILLLQLSAKKINPRNYFIYVKRKQVVLLFSFPFNVTLYHKGEWV